MINSIYEKQLKYIKSIDNEENDNFENNNQIINSANLLIDYIFIILP